MTITKLPSGRWRAQVWSDGKWRPVANIIGGERSYATKRDAARAKRKAQDKLEDSAGSEITVRQFHDRWLTDPLFARPKEATMIRLRERMARFVATYGDLPMARVGDDVVGEWLAGAKTRHSVPALRAMWNDAASRKAGRIVQTNPWAGLGLEQSTGNRHKQPPSEEMVRSLIGQARVHGGPYFAAWLQVACFTGMRPGELDALRWQNVDFATGLIRVSDQFSSTTRTFTTPKNGRPRDALLTPPAREALVGLPRVGEFCFVTHRDSHFTASSRAYHWKAIRAGAGWDGSLYLATRHFAGWYMINVLELASEDVAIALGHEDGGQLVRRLYGHRDRARALERVRAGYESVGNVRSLRAVRNNPA